MCDDNTSNSESSIKKRGWPKGKKRKKLLKDDNAPKKPVNGYVLFMNQRRESLMKENVGLPFAEITKLVGEEWSSMSSDQKSYFLETAKKKKEAYLKELREYKETDSYKKLAGKSQSTSSVSSNKVENKKNSSKNFNDPIFTEAFLDYNKSKENELHQLNRTNSEYEQHNSVLEGHIDNLKNAIIKLESETHIQAMKNKSLESKLLYFRELLFRAFSHIALPSTNEKPSVETIDDFMVKMCNVLEQNNDENVTFASAVYDAMANVSFQSLDQYWDESKFNHDQFS